MFEVVFYRLEDGTKPAGEFVKSIQDVKLKAKVIRGMKLLETYGNELREPDSRPLDDGIFELRVVHGSDIARCLYFFVSGEKIVVTNGFIKKTQKTPRAEVELAKKYREDYYRRYPDERS